ncbi:MAG TPA: AI-2E family transporter [Thermoanaerobaculia bacterium]|nr:AI-2E family transporter [Thermoanaerobaculia bacterium]
MELSTKTALRAAAVVLGLIFALQFLWIARAIFIVTFLGVLLGLAVARAADHLERLRIKRAFGAPLVILLGLGLLIGIGAFTAPTIREQTRELTRELPKSVEEIDRWLDRTPAKAILGNPQPAGASQQKREGLAAQLGHELRGATKFLFPILSSTFAAAAGVIIVLFIAMYIGATPGLYREGLLHLVPQRNRERAEEVVSTLRDTLRQWLIARLLAMVAIGVITGVGLALLQVKGAAALGLLAGLLEFIPFFGPFASAVPAIGIALVDSPQKALYVAILYLVVQQLEGNVITPLLLEKRLDIPPVLTVVAVSALGVVFGVLGMLIAEPLLAVVLVTTKMLYVQDVVGDDVKVGKAES